MKIIDLHRKLISDIYTNEFLLCLSGGQDSLTLLKLISDLKQDYSWKFGLIYFDHHYRKDSLINLQQLINVCKTTDARLFIYESFTYNKSELKSRNWRYNTTIDIAFQYNYSTILVAHTLTDISELFFQRVISVHNLDSLNNFNLILQNSSILNIIKPLLNIRRIETYWFCRIFCLPIWSDSTNYEFFHCRNRLRQELFPYLQRYFQPSLEQKILSFLQETQQDIEYLHKATLKLYFLIKHPIWSAINYRVLLNQPSALQNRLLKLFFKYAVHITLSIKEIKLIISKLTTIDKNTCIYTYYCYKVILTNSWLYIIIK